MRLQRSRKFKIAQTTTELAIFGTILIFILGVILRQAVGFSYTQNFNLMATRMAMKSSYEHSSGLAYHSSLLSEHGTSSHNSASILLVEDRLTSSSAKYGAIDRSPHIANGSATHSRNLLMPVEAWEHENLPVLDIYINGKHFALSLAEFKTVRFSDPTIPPPARKVFNDGNITKCSPNDKGYCWTDVAAFDLNRNGTIDDWEPSDSEFRKDFSWQWELVPISSLVVGDLLDVDGDRKQERVVEVSDSGPSDYIVVQDFTAGDFDYTQDTYDLKVEKKAKIGLTNDVQVYTFTKPEFGRTSAGTYLRVEQGNLLNNNNQIVRSTQKKDQIDLISRKIRLANDTEKFCYKGAPRPFSGGGANVLTEDKRHGMKVNPVEACGECNLKDGLNYSSTCMGFEKDGSPVIWVRSRIKDRRGRKWITDISSDSNIQL